MPLSAWAAVSHELKIVQVVMYWYADADDDFLDSLEEEPDEDETIEEEDFSIDDLIGMCSVVFVAIQNDEVEKQQEEDEAFVQLLSMDGRRIVT